jgi:glycerol transport system ATP-binding protein
MARIELKALGHCYGGRPRSRADYQLKPMSHAFDDGGAYALLGPSGCGKTTLLNVISGILTPSEGRLLFGARDMTHAPTAARNIAQVFQFPVVYDTMTVYDNLAFPLRNRRLPAAAVDKRVKAVAEMIGMTDRLQTRARGLTADAKQKISLGRGMVREDVAAILFDEPLTVIDPHMKWELRTQLKTLHREFGHTMIYVTHDQTEALTFADKVVVMHDGEVVQIGRPADLFSRPAHTFVGYFIGSPGMNVLPARIDGAVAHVMDCAIPLGRRYPALGPGRVEIGVRPEYVSLSERGPGLPVSVRRVEDVGRHRIVRAEIAGKPVNAVLGEDAPLADRADWARFDPRAVNVYVDGWLVEGEAA